MRSLALLPSQDALLRLAADLAAVPWQEGLDFLAVAANLKPLCIVMDGDDAIGAVAAREGLCQAYLAPWAAAGELPDWYAAAQRSWRARHKLLHVARDGETLGRAAALSARGVATPEEEAALLGYPLCCVAAQHQKALGLETLVAAMADRAACGDPVRRARMIEAGAAPLPVTDDECARFADLTAVTRTRSTSVNLCAACAADPASPARRLEAAYAALAARAHRG